MTPEERAKKLVEGFADFVGGRSLGAAHTRALAKRVAAAIHDAVADERKRRSMWSSESDEEHLHRMPLWRLIILADDVERECGSDAPMLRLITRLARERLRGSSCPRGSKGGGG